jgi:hypothetical protein
MRGVRRGREEKRRAPTRSRTEPFRLEGESRGPPGRALGETPTRVARIRPGLQPAPTTG